MGRKLSQMSWQDLKEELSIAGDPEKMIEIAKDIEALITPRMDVHNIAEVMNVQLILKKIIADFKLWENIERKRQHPKQ